MQGKEGIRAMKAKKVISVILASVIAAGAGYGIFRAVQVTTSQRTVTVFNASDLNYSGGYGYDSQTMQGVVTTDASQNIYVTDTEDIKHVYVKQGQAVREGDILLAYDTTKTGLNLEQEKLNNQQIRLNIEVAEKNLDTLRRMKPVSNVIPPDDFAPVDPSSIDDGDIVPDNGPDDIKEPGQNKDEKPGGNDREPMKLVKYRELTADSEAKNEMTADGTAEKPYLFLCEPDEEGRITIGTGFIRKQQEMADKTGQKQRYIVLEILDADDHAVSAWMQDIRKLDPDSPVTVDAATGNADFADLSAMTADQIAKALEGIRDTDKLAAALQKMSGDEEKLNNILKKMDRETREKLLQALTELQKEDDPRDTPAPSQDTPAPTQEPTAPPDPTPSPTPQGGEGSEPGTSPQPSPAEAAGDTEQSGGTVPASASSKMNAFRGVFADCKSYMRIGDDADDAVFSGETAGYSQKPACVGNGDFGILTADKSGTSLGSDSGTDSGSGSSGLISPDEEYSADELKQAIRDQESQLSDLRLDLQESDLKVKKAQQDVTDGVVKAKMNGIIKTAGDPDNPPTDGSPFLQLAGASGLYVKGGVYENRLSQIKEGTEVTITSWQSGNTYPATVKSISSYPDTSGMYGSDSSNSIYPFIAYIDSADAALTNGEYVQITMDSSGITPDNTANGESDFYLYGAFVLDENGKKYVYLRGKDKRLEKREIKTGTYENGSYQIKSGVSLSDWVAFPYGKDIREGAKTREGTIDELYS